MPPNGKHDLQAPQIFPWKSHHTVYPLESFLRVPVLETAS